MSVVVDTSVLIDSLRDVEAATQALARARRTGVLRSSTIVRAELLSGMRAAEELATWELLDSLTWHPVDEAVADEAGRLGRRWRPSHSGIDVADLLIAATATTLGLPVLTRNVRHFPMFPGLRSPY